MFERFSDDARRIVVLSQEQAKMLNHDPIECRHILLALLHDSDSPQREMLTLAGVDADDLAATVRSEMGVGPTPRFGHVPFTARARQVFDRALRVALEDDSRVITPVHLLIALLAADEVCHGLVAEAMKVAGEASWELPATGRPAAALFRDVVTGSDHMPGRFPAHK